ncbi:MAG: DNA-deoxyinosine glycosylase [bacterium]
MRCHSLPPIASRDAWVLVLGTMPGRVSLRERQYYAHPQNAFWKIAAEIFGFDASSDYSARVASLEVHGVAVWDVLKSCTRASSLDSDIDMSTIVPNDFKRFFARQPRIRRVCFNGAKAAALYLRHVQPHLREALALEHVRLPSTSPANASISRAEKLREWRAIERPKQLRGEPCGHASIPCSRF